MYHINRKSYYLYVRNTVKVELDDVMFWMDAVRNSEDKHRTLESFWKGQLQKRNNCQKGDKKLAKAI